MLGRRGDRLDLADPGSGTRLERRPRPPAARRHKRQDRFFGVVTTLGLALAFLIDQLD
jgi:hypothetical protein